MNMATNNGEAIGHGTETDRDSTMQFMVMTGIVAVLALGILGLYISGLYAGGLGFIGLCASLVALLISVARYGFFSKGTATTGFWIASGLFFLLVAG